MQRGMYEQTEKSALEIRALVRVTDNREWLYDLWNWAQFDLFNLKQLQYIFDCIF